MPNCPLCGKPREPVRQSPYSALNSDQFDASKAGDWFCDCSSNGRGNAALAYFWDHEVILNQEPTEAPVPFQGRVHPWVVECFGQEIASDKTERNHRFLEESLELVQSIGCTQHEAHQLVDYVFNRPVGDPPQEVGGVMVTLAALCLANALDMHDAGEVELARIWTKVAQIRAKQAAKPKHSPLPA